MAAAAASEWTSIDWSTHLHDADVLDHRLRYLDYGEGEPIVLIHGLGGSWQWWLENIPVLGRSNRVIAVDMPGFGNSEPLVAPFEFDVYTHTLEALVDQLELDRVVIVGHSLGGLMATRFALEHPDRLAGLVLVDAGGIALSPWRLQLIVHGFLLFNAIFRRPVIHRAFAQRPGLRRLLFRAGTKDASTLSGQLAGEILPLMVSPGFADGVVAGGKAAAVTGAERITTPTLLIWGRDDRILPVAQAEELASSLPDARLVVLDGVGHCPMFERPDEFNRALGRFAAEIAPMTAGGPSR